MAVKKRGKKWYVRFHFDNADIAVATRARNKSEAQRIEQAVLTAIRTGLYTGLDEYSKSLCTRLFQNRNWAIPKDLDEFSTTKHLITEEMTLWRAIETTLKYPDVKASQNRERIIQAFGHVTAHFGKDCRVKDIWIPHIKEYQLKRLDEGAAPSTISKEKSALSRMFEVLIELRYLEANPARMVRDLSQKESEREVYVSCGDFQEIVDQLPNWVRPIAQTAYYSGMRRGEILGLTRKHVNSESRIIRLRPDDVKEKKWKRVPIRGELLYILREAMKVRSFNTDRVFLVDGRPARGDSVRKPWVKAVQAVGLDPAPTFHDLRHTWKTNAMRSGVDFEIREAILGHCNRSKSVAERYGRISDEDLVRAVNKIRFDNGKTEILVRGSYQDL
ncbi:MAG: tyrosine-type recombinase/integrase [Desulfomonilaceae bacterium]